MTLPERAYLAGVIDARGAVTTLRHLRITIRQRHLDVILPMLKQLGPGGFALKAPNPSCTISFHLAGRPVRHYRLPKRKVICYEFGVNKTRAILEEVQPFLRRWKEFTRKLS